MLKAFIVFLLCLSATPAFATSLDQQIRTLAKLVDTGINGGSAEIVKYDIENFSYKPLVQDLLNTIKGSECNHVPAIGRRNVLSSGFAILTPEATELLKKISEDGNLKAALGYYWESFDGDAEFCFTESLSLYFTNGKALIIYLDSTT